MVDSSVVEEITETMLADEISDAHRSMSYFMTTHIQLLLFEGYTS